MRTNALALLRFFRMCVVLNARNWQAMVYGFLVPILFLVAFGSVFRSEVPALRDEMGQLLTITILGGACFGLPTTLVAERERGIWRRYRLLPASMASLLLCVLKARMAFILLAVVLQVGVAHFAYGTPLPEHPLQVAFWVVLVAASFLGMGFLIAALANDVPSVQAIGQCLFLPMIMVGGVGIPLLALPGWAQRLSGFMPGRYAVQALQRTYGDPDPVMRGGFEFAALVVIGAAAAVGGARLFRWDQGRRLTAGSWAWVAAALASWVAIGTAAATTGRLEPVTRAASDYSEVSESQIGSISYDLLPGDFEFVGRLDRPFQGGNPPEALRDFASGLRAWVPGQDPEPKAAALSLLSVAAIADVSQDLREGAIARLVFDDLRSAYGERSLRKILAWVILSPGSGRVAVTAPELGLPKRVREDVVRQRIDIYARKFLGRLCGRLRD